MVKFNISLKTTDDVKDFVNTASKYNFNIDLHATRYIVDAKSLMGIYSLDLSKPVELVAECPDEEAEMLKKDFAAFLA